MLKLRCFIHSMTQKKEVKNNSDVARHRSLNLQAKKNTVYDCNVYTLSIAHAQSHTCNQVWMSVLRFSDNSQRNVSPAACLTTQNILRPFPVGKTLADIPSSSQLHRNIYSLFPPRNVVFSSTRVSEIVYSTAKHNYTELWADWFK